MPQIKVSPRKWYKLSLLLAVSYGAWFVTGVTLPISTQDPPPHQYGWSPDERQNPLQQFDFSHGNWRAVIMLSMEDRLNKPWGYAYGNVLCTSDLVVLRQLQKMPFIVTGGDVATVTSGLYILKDGRRVFDTGIVLDHAGEGLQSRGFGWIYPAESGSLHAVCKQFGRPWWPVVAY